MMNAESLQIKGKSETTAYLTALEKDVVEGHLILLPADFAHREFNEFWISRRYLDHQSGEIYSLKGRIGGLGDQYTLERNPMRTKSVMADGTVLVQSNYNFRFFKPPLWAGFSLELETSPPIPDQPSADLTIDLSTCNYRVSTEINEQVVDAAIVNAVVRGVNARRPLFSKAVVKATEIRVHSIDTGFDTVDYAIRRCIDQAFDDGTDEPSVAFGNGLTIRKISMHYSIGLAVTVIPRTGT